MMDFKKGKYKLRKELKVNQKEYHKNSNSNK